MNTLLKNIYKICKASQKLFPFFFPFWRKSRRGKGLGSFGGALFFLFLFLSCENTLEFRGRDTQPLLVVNAFVTPDSVVRVHVSASRFFLAPDSVRVFDPESGRYVWQKIPFETISDATVSVTQNGRFFSMQNIGGGYYLSTEKPDKNGEIHIEVARSGFTTVSASTSFPTPVPVNFEFLQSNEFRHWISQWVLWYNYEWHTGIVTYTRILEGTFNIKFSDPPNISNYYRLFVTQNFYDKDGVLISYSRFLGPTLLREHLREIAGIPIGNDWNWPLYLEFSDELFDGKEFSISFELWYRNEEVLRPDSTSLLFQLRNDDDDAYRQWENWVIRYERYLEDLELGRFFTHSRSEIIVELQSISREFYLYLHSREQNRTSGGFFSEPVPIFNNIDGGIGIFAGYTSSVHRFEVTPERHPNVPVRRILFEDFEELNLYIETDR